MENTIYQLIQEHQIILISRHKNPDLDAYGAQFGLFYALKNAFPDKEIHVVGDTNDLNQFGPMDAVSDETVSKSLLFVLDTVAKQMLGDPLYDIAKKVVLIDHHQNLPDIRYDVYLRNEKASSSSEMVALLLQNMGIEIPYESAKALFIGIVSDSGRFMYQGTSSSTFRVAADLLEAGVDPTTIFNRMYTEPLQSKRVKAEFFKTVEISPKNVAYHMTDQSFLDQFDLDPNYASRGLVNQMAGIEEVPIWVNFTEDQRQNVILVEIRSREIPVLSVAKNHGGGGHLNACGCQVQTWDETKEIIKELDLLTEGNNG